MKKDHGIRIGLSGWSYPAWRSGFYREVPQRRWLAHCAAHFSTLEVNGTFYRLQNATTLSRWRDETPDDFVFAIKGHRAVTHFHRLKNVADSVAAQRENAAVLGDKLRAVLWQMPARLKKDMGRLAGFAEALGAWPGVRHALEFRDRSWFDSETADLLTAHRLSNCVSDAADWPRWDQVTSDLVYVRLHGAEQTYVSRYSDALIDTWAGRVAGWRRERRCVLVFFDNDANGQAPYDAMRLMAKLGIG